MLRILRSARGECDRSGWAVAASLVVAVGAVAVTLLAAARPHNLALGRHARASGQGYGTTASRAVDGLRHGQLGFHSGEESQPWLLVDLGTRRSVTGVAVFGRADCCFDQSIPLLLELSSDGEHFQPAGERKRRFTQFEPWVVKLRPERAARYVRLRAQKRGPLVLTEIEVYGR